MSSERPYEMDHLAPRLRSDFTGLLPEAQSGTVEEKERNFLSRALAAFAVATLSRCSLSDAAESVVDGGGDGGIDAVHFSTATHTLWVVQSKYIDTGRGEPSLGDVAKFKSGVEDLLQGKLDAFKTNAAWVAKLVQIQTAFQDQLLQIKAVLIYSGENPISDARIRLFEDVKHRFSPKDDYFEFLPCGLHCVHEWISGANIEPGVAEVQLTILSPGWIKEPYETIYGVIPITILADLGRQYGKELVAANIRYYKGETEVNQRIMATAQDDPKHFLYLNNGLTAYCRSLEVNHLDRANSESKRITAYGFSIVNGAQTVGSVAAAALAAAASEGYVFIKLISLERCKDDHSFAQAITQSTNFQNQIGHRDFVALDKQQERIATQLRLDEIEYHYKDSDDTPPSDQTNFTLDEATKALACMEADSDCDFCSRVLGNPNSLWSQDIVYEEPQTYRTRYHRLYRDDRSSRTIWRAVQTRRIVIERMRAEGQASVGVRKGFFETGRALCLNLIFLRLHPQQGESLTLTAQETEEIKAQTIIIAEAMWTACQALGYVTSRIESGTTMFEQPRNLRSVFCSAPDCKRVRNKTLAVLNAPPDHAAGTAAAPPIEGVQP